MEKKEKDIAPIITNILYFVLGILFICATTDLIKTFNYVLVCVCAIIGVIQIINYLLSKEKKQISIMLGVIFIWAALLLYVYYGFYNLLPVLFSLYLFIMGVNCFQEIKEKQTNKWIKIIFGVCALIIGVLLILAKEHNIFTYLKVTGIYLIIVSVYPLIEYIKNYKK